MILNVFDWWVLLLDYCQNFFDWSAFWVQKRCFKHSRKGARLYGIFRESGNSQTDKTKNNSKSFITVRDSSRFKFKKYFEFMCCYTVCQRVIYVHLNFLNVFRLSIKLCFDRLLSSVGDHKVQFFCIRLRWVHLHVPTVFNRFITLPHESLKKLNFVLESLMSSQDFFSFKVKS
jgi:hypothetical protein